MKFIKIFRNIINTAIFNFVPFVNVKCKRTPWFHKSLKRLRSDKQNKWRKYTRSRNIVTYAEYKSAANKFKSEFLKSKCDYEKLLFISQNSNSKFFKYVKSQSEARYAIPCIKKNDETFAISDYEKAWEFLNYFSSVF